MCLSTILEQIIVVVEAEEQEWLLQRCDAWWPEQQDEYRKKLTPENCARKNFTEAGDVF